MSIGPHAYWYLWRPRLLNHFRKKRLTEKRALPGPPGGRRSVWGRSRAKLEGSGKAASLFLLWCLLSGRHDPPDYSQFALCLDRCVWVMWLFLTSCDLSSLYLELQAQFVEPSANSWIHQTCLSFHPGHSCFPEAQLSWEWCTGGTHDTLRWFSKSGYYFLL